MIELPPLASPVDQLWHALLDLSDRLTADDTNPAWSLVPAAIRGQGQITYRMLAAALP